MVSPQSPFQYWMCWLIGRIQGRSATRQGIQNKPSIILCPLQGWENVGQKKQTKKKKIPQKKKKILFLMKSFFFCRFFFFFFAKSHLKGKKKNLSFSFFFVFIFKNRTSGWLYINTSDRLCAEGVSCEVVVCRLVLEMMKVHLHWRDNQAGHGWKKQRQEEEG